jgi:transposase InsO family protein
MAAGRRSAARRYQAAGAQLRRGPSHSWPGKAERFIQTLLREWAYLRPYRSSKLRARALPLFLNYYNQERPHGSLGGRPPSSRLKGRV